VVVLFACLAVWTELVVGLVVLVLEEPAGLAAL
jgi:hypothetical protein